MHSSEADFLNEAATPVGAKAQLFAQLGRRGNVVGRGAHFQLLLKYETVGSYGRTQPAKTKPSLCKQIDGFEVDRQASAIGGSVNYHDGGGGSLGMSQTTRIGAQQDPAHE